MRENPLEQWLEAGRNVQRPGKNGGIAKTYGHENQEQLGDGVRV